MKAHAGCLLALLALFGAGCAGSGRGVAADGAPAAAFIAPDGARATPNTGASRLADGPGAGVGAPAAATPVASVGGPQAGDDGVVFTYAGGGSAVNLAGDFNSWSADADPMAKQADGSFRLVKKLEPGRYAYKFVVDGQWQADPKAAETVDDGFGGKNSVVIVGGSGAATPAPAPVTPAAPVAGTTTADGAVFSYQGAGSSVNVAGEFNGWDMAADPMVKQTDGSFRLVKKLEPGRYAYKFVVDGQWQVDPKATETIDDGFGGKNSVIVIGGAASTVGAPSAGTPSSAAPSPASGKGLPPAVTAEGVRFTFGGAARTVHLAGDFNAWSITADPLARGADGTWTIVRKLPSGTHAYKFVVDGTTWKTDEANPSSVDDGFGGKNSLVTVP